MVPFLCLPVFLSMAVAAPAQGYDTDHPGFRPRPQIFLAPSGKPFRAPRDEPYPVAIWFAQADLNHDGRLDLAEFTADFERFFQELDVDHDGRLGPQEIDRYEKEVAPEVQAFEGDGMGFGHGGGGRGGGPGGGRGGGRGGHQGHRGGGAMTGERGQGRRVDADRPIGGGRFGLINIPEPVASMDVDLSGSVTLQEARRAAVARFATLDTRHQGFLAVSELPQTYVQSRSFERRRKSASGPQTETPSY